jgi:hypothetical protein
MELDNLTIAIDKLLINSLRGFNPEKIKLHNYVGLHRVYQIMEGIKNADKVGDVISIDKDYFRGPTIDGFWNECFFGICSGEYKEFRKGCLGKEAPKNPMNLSFKEAFELYGDLAILKTYNIRKKAYDRGVEVIKKFPNFLNKEQPQKI